tara:strand:- start:25 stop:513 length:489 start_codon:yes stop_codon:yes gene_type:complete
MTLQYIKKCGDFFIACSAQGTKGEVGLELSKDRNTIFNYVFYGSVKISEPFSNSIKTLDGKKGELVDVKEFLGKTVIYEFLENTHTFGFNLARNSTDDWTGKLIEKNGGLEVTKKSILICLDGSPIVNGKTLARYDYDELLTTKSYDIDLKTDGVLALFTVV